MARGKTIADAGAAGESGGTDARGGPDGEDGFVVIDDDFVEPGGEELNQPSLAVEDTAAAQDATPFSPAAFPALGASLAARVASSPTATQQGGNPRGSRANPSSSETTDETAPRFDAAAAAVIAAGDLVYKFLYAYAVMAYRFLHAHGAVAFDFLYTHALVVFEFLYAYAVVAVQETLAILEKVWSRARPTWRRWREHGPAPVKRVMKHKLFPVAVAVALSMLLVLPAYWAIPRGGGGGGDGPGRLSARQWQAKYDLLNSKYSADLVRQRLKYDSLAGRHLELQSEYEELLKGYKNQQRAARANRNGPKSPPETCDRGESVLGPVKEALKTAEQSAYEYFSHFSEGLRQDVHEIAERCLGKTGEEGGGGGGGDAGVSGEDERERNSNRVNANSPIDDERKNSSNDRGGGGGETDSPAAAIEQANAPAYEGLLVQRGHLEYQPALEQKKTEGEFQSQQQVHVQQQDEQMEEIEAERRRVRVARRGVKGGKLVGWALKIEKPEAPSTAELLDMAERAGLKQKTESEAEEIDDRQGAKQMPDDLQAALDRAKRGSSSAGQTAREPSGERTDGQTSEVSGSAEMEEKVGGRSVDEVDKAGDDGTRDGARGVGDDKKKTSDDVNITDAVVVVFDEAASDGVEMVQDVNLANGADIVEDVGVGDGKQVADDKRSLRSLQGSDKRSLRSLHGSGSGHNLGKEEDDIARESAKYFARRKEIGAVMRAKRAILVELSGGDLKDVPKDSGAKAAKPEEVKSEDIKVIDEQPQTNKSYKVALEDGELEAVRPHDPKKDGTSKFVKVEEVEPKGSTAGGKRKCSKPKDVNPRDGEKGQKGGKWKEYRLNDEEDKPKKKKKKNKDGKSRGKKKE